MSEFEVDLLLYYSILRSSGQSVSELWQNAICVFEVRDLRLEVELENYAFLVFVWQQRKTSSCVFPYEGCLLSVFVTVLPPPPPAPPTGLPWVNVACSPENSDQVLLFS